MAASESKEPTLLFPGLAPFYTSVSDLWYPLIRITVGGILLVHGLDKVIHIGLTHETAFMTKIGFVPAAGFAAVPLCRRNQIRLGEFLARMDAWISLPPRSPTPERRS
jgi:uncharacterized membrane protein YphA (DoxX/SURF4 family)